MSKTSEILDAYGFWDGMARKKNKEKQRLRDRKTSIKVIYTDAPGGEPEDMADYVAKIAEIDEDLEEIRAERDRALSAIIRLTLRLESAKQVDIIFRRYIHQDSWRRICRDLGISRTAAVRLHDRAVKALEDVHKSGS